MQVLRRTAVPVKTPPILITARLSREDTRLLHNVLQAFLLYSLFLLGDWQTRCLAAH